MKKFLKAMTAIFAVAILAFAIVGCNSGVKGKTYVFSDVTVTYPAGATEEVKEALDSTVASMKESMKGQTITFESDGSFKANGTKDGTWKQDGDTVTVTSGSTTQKLKVNGNKVQLSYTESNVTVTMIFVQK